MLIGHWIVTAVLASLCLYADGAKLVRSREQAVQLMQWVEFTPM